MESLQAILYYGLPQSLTSFAMAKINHLVIANEVKRSISLHILKIPFSQRRDKIQRFLDFGIFMV
ncbi:hypothetical protein [Helicobacter sp.]|uniref:hypothetical protein n=1 Tax=Helicobacter sp. TaxID=218 RepID=UPI002A919A83|nr:hypothetical protein [Helicobacter sp.]MDY5557497.1 hypothetical protein [Helicobacter sp.]